MALRLKLTTPLPVDPDDNRAELTEHLAELRTRLIRSCIYCAVGMAVMWILADQVFAFLASPITSALHKLHQDGDPLQGKLLIRNFTDAFFIRIQVSAIGGLILAIPFVMMELWGFIEPALTVQESKAVKFVAPLSIILFLAGVGCACFIMPMAIRWFLGYVAALPNAILLQDPLVYIVFYAKLMLVFGVMFQLPVILMFLGKVGIITSSLMIKYWRQAAVGIFTAAMVVAPSNDPGTMLALAIPLTILYLASIKLVKWIEPKLEMG